MIDQQFTWYDAHTQWPEGFDPSEHDGLCKIDMAFYRQLRCIFVENYLVNSYWKWDTAATISLMKRFDITVTDIPVPVNKEMMAVLTHLKYVCNLAMDHFVLDESVVLPKKEHQYPSVAERMQAYGLTEEQECYPRILEPISFMLWAFPDGYIHRYDAFANYSMIVCPMIVESLELFEEKQPA